VLFRSQVALLDRGGGGGGDAQRVVTERGERVRGRSRQTPHGQPERAPTRGGAQDVRAGAGGGQQDEDVAGPAVSLDLAGEHLLRAVVVDDRAQAGGLGAQRDRREGATVVEEAADQLGGEVLCLGGAAAVARGEQPGARGEPVGQLPAPFLDSGGGPVEEVERGVQLRAVLVEPVPGGHAVTSRAWSAACRACGATTSTYADSVAVATCRQLNRSSARARAAAPTAVRRPGSASSAVTAAASATGSRGGTS